MITDGKENTEKDFLKMYLYLHTAITISNQLELQEIIRQPWKIPFIIFLENTEYDRLFIYILLSLNSSCFIKAVAICLTKIYSIINSHFLSAWERGWGHIGPAEALILKSLRPEFESLLKQGSVWNTWFQKQDLVKRHHRIPIWRR